MLSKVISLFLALCLVLSFPAAAENGTVTCVFDGFAVDYPEELKLAEDDTGLFFVGQGGFIQINTQVLPVSAVMPMTNLLESGAVEHLKQNPSEGFTYVSDGEIRTIGQQDYIYLEAKKGITPFFQYITIMGHTMILFTVKGEACGKMAPQVLASLHEASQDEVKQNQYTGDPNIRRVTRPNKQDQEEPAGAESERRAYEIREIRTEGINGSFVSFPELVYGDPGIAEKVSASIRQLADISSYQSKLDHMTDPGRVLSVSFDDTLENWHEEPLMCSILITAVETENGIITDQRYYPMTFDLADGELIPFERLFTDPAHARKSIEEEIENRLTFEIAPCIKSGSLLPVPFERFFVSGQGDLVLYYERDQLEFASGYAGAVAFLYDELWEDLDTALEGPPKKLMWMSPFEHAFADRYEPDHDMTEGLYETGWNLSLYGMTHDIYLATPLSDALEQCHGSVREGAYGDGDIWIETEDAQMRGTKLITNAGRQTVTGIFSSRINDAGFVTEKSTRNKWLSTLGEPAASWIIDEESAKKYQTVPGYADIYELSFNLAILENDQEHAPEAYIPGTNGYAQYILFSDKNEILHGILFRLAPPNHAQ